MIGRTLENALIAKLIKKHLIRHVFKNPASKTFFRNQFVTYPRFDLKCYVRYRLLADSYLQHNKLIEKSVTVRIL